MCIAEVTLGNLCDRMRLKHEISIRKRDNKKFRKEDVSNRVCRVCCTLYVEAYVLRCMLKRMFYVALLCIVLLSHSAF